MEKWWIIKNWLLLSKCYFMKNKFNITLVLLNLFYLNMNSQVNIIPNGSFEVVNPCPSLGPGEINKAIPWFQPNFPEGLGGSSDIFNVCNNTIPLFTTFQYPRTGNGYGGIYLFWEDTNTDRNNWREYIEVGLTDSLKKDKKYCIRFYTNKGNISSYAIKNIQAVLTTDSLLYNSPDYVYISGVSPIMEADSIITDTLNWIKVETTYTANGGEKFLTIGNFSSGANTIYKHVWPFNGIPNTLGYYLIDDVSIYEQPEVFAGNDTLLTLGDSVQLGIVGRSDIFYIWQPSTGLSNPNIANPIAKPKTCITYTLTVTDTNQLACTNRFTDVVKIDVINCDTSTTLTIPNVFSPNNDGINDEFKITSKKIKQLNCKIYNRWGILVGELTAPNAVWDGLTTSGEEATGGTYFYVLTALGEDGKEYEQKGYVQLVR